MDSASLATVLRLSESSCRPVVQSRRFTQYEVRLQNIFRAVGIRLLPLYLIEQGLERHPSQFRLGHFNRGQRRQNVLGDADVVETDDGEILGNADHLRV